MAMRFLITGCAGFIGSQLAARLLELGHGISGIDNFDETLYSGALHRAQLAPLLSHARFRFHEGDLLDDGLLDSAMTSVDAVVHLAALAGVRPSLTQARRYMRVNVEGTQAVLDACAKKGVRRIVFASSSSVYGARSRVPFAETDEVSCPASPYAASKRAGELICATHVARTGAAICALRFFTVYGPHQRPEMAIAKFARLLLQGEKIPLYGDGNTARDYTYIDDILDGILAAIERTAQPIAPFRIYNLGGAHVTTLKKLVEMLEAALGQHARIGWLGEQPGDVPLTCADLARSTAELGYVPKVSIEEGIDRYCRWLRSHNLSHSAVNS